MVKIIWTQHSWRKMKFYKLSEQRVKRILNSPHRVEEGIAPNTIAMMQTAGSKKHPYEIWAMLQKSRIKADRDADKRRYGIRENLRDNPRQSASVKIISAWKYPGRTKAGESLPIEIIREINEAARLS